MSRALGDERPQQGRGRYLQEGRQAALLDQQRLVDAPTAQQRQPGTGVPRGRLLARQGGRIDVSVERHAPGPPVDTSGNRLEPLVQFRSRQIIRRHHRQRAVGGGGRGEGPRCGHALRHRLDHGQLRAQRQAHAGGGRIVGARAADQSRDLVDCFGQRAQGTGYVHIALGPECRVAGIGAGGQNGGGRALDGRRGAAACTATANEQFESLSDCVGVGTGDGDVAEAGVRAVDVGATHRLRRERRKRLFDHWRGAGLAQQVCLGAEHETAAPGRQRRRSRLRADAAVGVHR